MEGSFLCWQLQQDEVGGGGGEGGGVFVVKLYERLIHYQQ